MLAAFLLLLVVAASLITHSLTHSLTHSFISLSLPPPPSLTPPCFPYERDARAGAGPAEGHHLHVAGLARAALRHLPRHVRGRVA